MKPAEAANLDQRRCYFCGSAWRMGCVRHPNGPPPSLTEGIGWTEGDWADEGSPQQVPVTD